ncbi:MAG: repeat-containing protein [Chthonomonadaceae bacterium]|nr:repeat-containing protein [Chthonomonadaceae bacterium]
MHRFQNSLLSLASVVGLLLLAAIAQAADYYVDAGFGNDANPGTQAQPFKTIQIGINTAAANDTLFVAAGTYREALVWSSKDLTLQGVGVGQSILDPSTAHGGPGGVCLSTTSLTSAASLSGFTIQGGRGTGPVIGGGISNNASSPTISNCLFTGNFSARGGGIGNSNGSSPTISNCTITNNTAASGGGMYNDTGSNPTLSNCSITSNGLYPPATNGAGIYTTGGGVTLVNCSFHHNIAQKGGALYFSNSTATIVNTDFYVNYAVTAPLLYCNNSTPQLTNCSSAGNYNLTTTTTPAIVVSSTTLFPAFRNCILWDGSDMEISGPATLLYSDVLGLPNTDPDANGNFGADPYYHGFDPVYGDQGLYPSWFISPCINRGNNAYVTADLFPTDSAGNIMDKTGRPRIADGTVDLGAHEYVSVTPNADAYSTDENTPLVVAASGVLANDIVVGSDVMVASLYGATGPQHGTVTMNPDGSFTYTPAPNFHGTDTFSYAAYLRGDFNSGSYAWVTITVNPVNHPPVATDDAYSLNQDTALTVPANGLLANDTDAEGSPLMAALVSSPTHGALTLQPDGSFLYTPAANYAGPDTFTYEANDGANDSNVATVHLTVRATPPAEVTGSVSFKASGFTAAGGTNYTQTLTITNTTGSAINGPIYLVLDSLGGANVQLTNQNGTTLVLTPTGRPYLTLSGPLAAQGSVKVTLKFSNPGKTTLSYTPRLFAGPGSL